MLHKFAENPREKPFFPHFPVETCRDGSRQVSAFSTSFCNSKLSLLPQISSLSLIHLEAHISCSFPFHLLPEWTTKERKVPRNHSSKITPSSFVYWLCFNMRSGEEAWKDSKSKNYTFGWVGCGAVQAIKGGRSGWQKLSYSFIRIICDKAKQTASSAFEVVYFALTLSTYHFFPPTPRAMPMSHWLQKIFPSLTCRKPKSLHYSTCLKVSCVCAAVSESYGKLADSN